MEHRWGHRREIKKVVRVLCDSRTGTGSTQNMSVSGAWICSSVPAQPLAQVQVGFSTSRQGGKTLDWVAGTVVRTAVRGFAVEWHDLAHPTILSLLSGRLRREGRSAARRLRV